MKDTLSELGLAMAVGVLVGLALVVVFRDGRPAEADDAVRLCEETGGQLLVTEYNTVTGLTLNCFYSLEEVGINPEPDSIAL